MEDVQGKKIVFRNGWKPDSTYLLLNYRDEGDGGMNFRDYLRDSIPVEEEKMTHGHADENSIALLMSGGSVLLQRRRVPRLHAERAVRRVSPGLLPQPPGRAPREDLDGPEGRRGALQPARADPRRSPLFEFLRDAGSYRPVRTRKVDFLSLPEFDYSRTRLIDDGWGYDADRSSCT